MALERFSDSSSSRIGLLVVDDEAAIVEMLLVGLELQGFTIWAATDPVAGLELFRQHSADIHLALLDVRMPGMDGPALMDELRALKPTLTCCFMSGSIDPYTEQDLIDRGAVAVIPKPFSIAEVVTYLRQIVGQSERRKSLRLAAPTTQVNVGGQQVRLRDRSGGGLGLWSANPLAVGSVHGVHFEQDKSPDRSIEVRHCRPDGQGYVIGCRFVG